jgi:glycosyltransferase involved in cell wall biosynthesis
MMGDLASVKILHVVTFFDEARSYGGPLTVAMNLAKEQLNQGHEVTLVALSGKRISHHENGLVLELFEARSIFKKSRFSTLFSAASIQWMLKNASNFDVVHQHFARDLIQIAFANVALFRKKRVFLQTHGMLTNVEVQPRKIQKLFDILLVHPLMRRVFRVLALHTTEQIALQDAFQKSRISIVPNGVYFGDLEINPGHSSQVSFISRLHSQKNPLEFISAAKMLVDSGFSARFVVAGPDGGLAEEVSRAVESDTSGKISYLGALGHDDVIKTLINSDLLVLPSANDPFPMIVLEALSQGVPVIVSESCPIAEIVQSLNVGEVFSPKEQELSELIKIALRKNRSPLDVWAASKVVFNLERIVSNLSDLYRMEREGGH